MSNKKNGGQAFPELTRLDSPSHEYKAFSEGGMTLRDYFAAQSVTGFLSTCEREPGGATSSLNVSDIARASYELADALLIERAK